MRAWIARSNLASAIYGQILLLTILGVERNADGVTAERVLIVVLTSQLVFWLAHAYAETLGHQLSIEDRITGRRIREVMVREWPIAQSAAPTVVLMTLALLSVMGTTTAIDIATGLAVVSLFGWGFAAARRSHDTLTHQLLVGSASAGLGLVIVALELAIHELNV
jgi:hypothetical protein